MKKLLIIERDRGKFCLKKTLIIMKLITLLLCLNLVHISAKVYSQNERFTINAQKIQVQELLDKIESESNYKFLYRSDYIKSSYINLNVQDFTLAELLSKAFEQTNISYLMLDDQLVVVAPKNFINATQQSTIKGVITDAVSGVPLPGVNIVIEGTTTGTVTDVDGKYSIDVPSPNSVLLYSFVGYNTERVEVNSRLSVDVALVPLIESLEEVVVVGYGTQKKKDLTGSVVRMDMDGKELTPTTDLTQVLQGYVPGLNATSGSSAGETGGLSIRGKTSLSASDYPLIVVDGIIFKGSTADLNVNDIQSVDVLKDASAAAVYGYRSANGVIAITTKKGTSEKPQFNFNTYYGFQNLANTERTKVMNAEQYAVRLVDYYYQQDLYDWYETNPINAGDRPVRPDITDKELVASYLRTAEEQENYLAGNEVDWLDEVFQVAPIQSYNLSVSGKTQKTNYYLSTSYTNQEGILLNDKFQRLTFFGRFENKINDWLSIEFDPTYSHRDYSGLSASAGYALQASPLGNMYDEDGNYPVYIAGESYNYHPLGNLLVDDSSPEDFFNLVLKGKVEVPWVRGLRYEINYSKSYTFDRYSRYYPTTVADGSKVDGLAEKENEEEKNWLLNNIITYDRTFADKHKLNLTYLFSRENLYGETSFMEGTGFENEMLGYNSMELAENQEFSTGAYEENTISYMGRINYSYDSRYLLTATIRRDGFSGFGKSKKFGNFPSLSLGWVLSEESFLGNTEWIDFLKLRVSYGINGNQGIGRYYSQSKMGSNSTVFDGATAIGIYSYSLGNSELGWEKTASFNTGIDYNLWDNRISGSIDVYKAETTDVLVERSIPRASGNSSVWTNIGGIENKGIEVSLSADIIRTSDFNWRTSLAYSMVRNKITKLYDDVTEDIGNSWFVGESINAIYGYKNMGVWQEEDLFNGTIIEDYYPGQFKIKDLNEDGEITAEDDREILGSTDANYRFSVNNSFSYKNISFSFFLNSIQGGNGYYMASNTGAVVAGGTDMAYRLNRTAIRDYWRPDNPVNNAPGMYYNPSINPGVYQDKSYIRLQDVTLAYTFSPDMLAKLKINGLKVYVTGKNLYTWTDWSGWDPETGSPMMRSVIGGVNISF